MAHTCGNPECEAGMDEQGHLAVGWWGQILQPRIERQRASPVEASPPAAARARRAGNARYEFHQKALEVYRQEKAAFCHEVVQVVFVAA